MAIVYPVEIKDVLKIQDGPLTGNLKAVMDGTNTPSALRLSTSQVEINGKVWPTEGATAGKVLSIDNFGRLVWATPQNQSDGDYLPLTGGTITGDLTVQGSLSIDGDVIVDGPLSMKTASETVIPLSPTSGTITVNVDDGSYFTVTLTGSTTFTFGSPPAGRAMGFILEITNGGSHNVFWPSSVRWPKGLGPSLSAASTDLISFITRDGGVTWYGTFRPGV